MAGYDERMLPPWWLWLVSAVFFGTFGVAFGKAFGTPTGLLAAVVAETVGFLILWSMRARVRVVGGALEAGQARLPLQAAGEVTVLDAESAALLRGRRADARAWLYLRWYVPTAVTVVNTDPADPVPYWYVSTRTPQRLADALTSARRLPSARPDA